jgi:hypothetical protein
MSSNRIPTSYEPLIELMEDAADGAQSHGVAIGLKQNTEGAIRADLGAIIGRPAGPGGVPPAEPGLKALLNAAKTNKTAKTAAVRSACSNGRTLATTCINSLKPVLGKQWTAVWNAAGFTGGSLAVPTNPMVMLQQLRAYYIANPAREVPDINGIACTAVGCEAAAQSISTTQSESNQSNTEAGTAQANVEEGLAQARRRMTGLRQELSQILGDEEERWYAFGFDRPADPNTPAIPENLTITPGAPGSRILFAHCDNARRAESYRFRVTNAATGVQLAERLSNEPEAMLGGLASGASVNITVSAHNEAGESQPSAPVSATVP